jgi:hypothetical protein
MISFSVESSSLIELLAGVSASRITEEYPLPEQIQLLNVALYCCTNGFFQEYLHRLRRLPINQLIDSIALTSGLFKVSHSQFWSTISELHTYGYSVLPFKLDPTLIESLLQSTSRFAESKRDSYIYQSENNFISEPITIRYDQRHLRVNKLVKLIAEDKMLSSVASIYLRTSIVVRDISFWRSFPTSTFEPSSESAQLFHFDLDELRWLKVFIYLTDVGPQNGPHVYIPSSHRPGSKPDHLLSRGYSRISDDDIEKYYPKDTWKSLCLPKGSIFFADTRCWHKGTPLYDGIRDILSIEYAPSFFSKRLVS